MTLKEVKEIKDKLNEIVNNYPELGLIPQVTFSQDMIEKHIIHPCITLCNSPVSATERKNFCKQHNVPYVSYNNGEFDEASFEPLSYEG